MWSWPTAARGPVWTGGVCSSERLGGRVPDCLKFSGQRVGQEHTQACGILLCRASLSNVSEGSVPCRALGMQRCGDLALSRFDPLGITEKAKTNATQDGENCKSPGEGTPGLHLDTFILLHAVPGSWWQVHKQDLLSEWMGMGD